MTNLERRVSALERLRPPRIPDFRDTFPWLDDAGVGKVAAATLEASLILYEATRDGDAAMVAAALFAGELAGRLRDDPAAEAEPLGEFETVAETAIPTIDALLDAAGWRGHRRYPTPAERYLARRDVEDLGGRMLRPRPPGMPREPFIRIPDPTPPEGTLPWPTPHR